MIDSTDLDETKRHLQYLVKECLLVLKKRTPQNISVKWNSRLAPFSPFFGRNGLIQLTGRTKRLPKVDMDVKILSFLTQAVYLKKISAQYSRESLHQ